MRFLGLGCLALLACLFLPLSAQAASYPPDLVCYNMDNSTTPPTPLCAANEYVKTCTTHPNTHLATTSSGPPPVVECIDNAPMIVPPLLDAWYPAWSDPYMAISCPVPNTYLYTGPIPVPPNSCIGTTTTPQDDSYGWFCEDNANYHPQYGPQGYKCVLNTPQVCPGLPPYHLEEIPGYPDAYQCVENAPPRACSSTEILTTTGTGTPPTQACVQQFPWTSATIPGCSLPLTAVCMTQACPTGEVLINDGKNPAHFGCDINNSCPAGSSIQIVETAPDGSYTVSACVYPNNTSCPAGQVAKVVDPAEIPLRYTCETPAPPSCPPGQTLITDTTTNPPTYSCMTPPAGPGTIVCPAGEVAILTPTPTTEPYYICNPVAPPACPPGQNRQASGCVPNSGHVPTCSAGQTPVLMTPVGGATYVCQVPPAPVCPAGQHADYSAPPGWPSYTCVADPTNPNPGACAPGEFATMTSAGPPPTYACTPAPPIPTCPPGQYASVTSTSPLTYGCTNGGD